MNYLKIAASNAVRECFRTEREIVPLDQTDYTDVAVAVFSRDDVLAGALETIKRTGFDIPIFLVASPEGGRDALGVYKQLQDVLLQVNGVFDLSQNNKEYYGHQLETAAKSYEDTLLPPFFNALKQYTAAANATFACPGHQGGQFFRKHPAGRQFFDFFGETLFRADLCNADVKLGDLLIHEGPALLAQKHAARVFNADKTYFVLNGTSASNKVVTNALLTPGDLVLFDRNNHKSVHQGALIQAGATPVYLETARKLILEACTLVRPFVPETIDGRPWQDHPTDTIASDTRFFEFHPKDRWHAFPGYAEKQYFIDPCKLLFTTPGIDPVDGSYTDFGIHAGILANFLRENGIVPEKCDLNSILFLLTPAEDWAKMSHLAAQIARFERFVQDDAPMSRVLPAIYAQYEDRYSGYTIRRLCQEMHDLYRSYNVQQLQKDMFRKSHFPKKAMNPQAAQIEFIRGNVERVPLADADGRIAAEGALPYPPGILCVVPGEIWGGAVLQYFLALEEGINRLPGFTPELQGVYLKHEGGRTPRLRLRAQGLMPAPHHCARRFA